MKAKATLLGHPIHQMLIVFPLGLLGTAAVFDVLFLLSQKEIMAVVSYWMITAGIVGAVVAIPFGMIDYSIIPPNTRAKRIGFLHGFGNGIVSLFFGLSWLFRAPDTPPSMMALACSFAGVALSLVTAWLGGELVSRLGIGVHGHNAPNASSSLNEAKK
jgi:uncharacterized membrane protein